MKSWDILTFSWEFLPFSLAISKHEKRRSLFKSVSQKIRMKYSSHYYLATCSPISISYAHPLVIAKPWKQFHGFGYCTIFHFPSALMIPYRVFYASFYGCCEINGWFWSQEISSDSTTFFPASEQCNLYNMHFFTMC